MIAEALPVKLMTVTLIGITSRLVTRTEVYADSPLAGITLAKARHAAHFGEQAELVTWGEGSFFQNM